MYPPLSVTCQGLNLQIKLPNQKLYEGDREAKLLNEPLVIDSQ